jgi:hypothetical protein
MIAGGVAWTEWSTIAEIFDRGSKTDKEQAARLRAAAAIAPDVACLEAYLPFYFTDGGAGDPRKRIGTGAIETEAPKLLDRRRRRNVSIACAENFVRSTRSRAPLPCCGWPPRASIATKRLSARAACSISTT